MLGKQRANDDQMASPVDRNLPIVALLAGLRPPEAGLSRFSGAHPRLCKPTTSRESFRRLPHRAVIKDLAFATLNKAFCLPVKIGNWSGK